MVFFVLSSSFAQDCKKSFSQWGLDQDTVSYIASTSLNHAKLEIRNYNNWAECSGAEFVYGERTAQIPEERFRIAKSLRDFGGKNDGEKIRSFLKKCQFDNNYMGNGKAGDSCPNRFKSYSETINSGGQNLELSCAILDSDKALVIKIGSVVYKFPYVKNEVFAPGVHKRNLNKNINLENPFIFVNSSPLFKDCDDSINYSKNFCRKEKIKLKASNQNLVCESKDSKYRYCTYGHNSGTEDNLKISSKKTCPLELKKTQNITFPFPFPMESNTSRGIQ